MNFNSARSTMMHIDLNSCFATIEQQANPYLRGKPIAVAAYPTPNGCILAPSIEAKRYGVKTGMRVRDGKLLCPNLIVLSSDPWKYRNVHLGLRKLISRYTNEFSPKSIDEFVLNLSDYEAIGGGPLQSVGKEIKERIRKEIGEWLTVSIGIAPNRYLAKIAAGLHKPDGLDEINKNSFYKVYKELVLGDLTGIKDRNTARLNSVGIYTVLDFYKAPIWKLKAAFHSITSRYWYTRLHGYEIDNVEFSRRSYGNSVALGKTYVSATDLSPILSNLVAKTSARMRAAGYKARGVHLAVSFKDGSFVHRGKEVNKLLFDFRDIYREVYRLLSSFGINRPVRDIAVSCFNLVREKSLQLELFSDIERKEKTMDAIDSVNKRWGDFVIKPGRMLSSGGAVLDRIAFGGVKELEEFTTQ